MANAKKCDRCGAFYSRLTTPDLKITLYKHYCGEETIDLCDDCMKSLAEFLKIDIDLTDPLAEAIAKFDITTKDIFKRRGV